MKNITFILIALFFNLGLYAQSLPNPIEEGLNSGKIKKFIHLNYIPGKGGGLNYTVDREYSVSKSAPFPSTLFLASQDDNFNMMIDFLNPVKYSLSVSETVSKDPQVESGNKFVSSIIELLNLVNPEGTPKITIPKLGASIDDLTQKSTSSYLSGGNIDKTAINDLLIYIKSESIVELALQLVNNDQTNCLPAAQKVEFIKKVSLTDQGFYQFQTDAKGLLNRLGKLSSITEVENGLAQFTADITALESLNNTVITNSDDLLKNINNASILTWASTGDCVILKRYVDNKINIYTSSVKQVTASRKEIIKNFKSLLAQFQEIITRREKNKEYYLLKNINIEQGTVKEIKINLKEQDIAIEENSIVVTTKAEQSFLIRARNYSGVVLEFSSGIIFTGGLTYPTYGTSVENNKTLVRSGGDKYVDYALSSMLNIIFNTGRSFVYPMVQAGVGTGKSLPLLFFGVGGRFIKPINHLAISFGPVFAWRQELTSLRDGSEVSGTADIEKDLKYRFNSKPNLYIGIQYSF